MIEHIENLEDLKINYFEQSAKFDEDLEGDPIPAKIARDYLNDLAAG